MSSRLLILRNVAIILLIAAAVQFLPGGGDGAHEFSAVLGVLFSLAIAMIATRLYKEHRVAIHGLGRHRAVLYGAIALGVLAAAGRSRMFEHGLTEFIWFVLVGLAIFAFVEVYRFWRSY